MRNLWYAILLGVLILNVVNISNFETLESPIHSLQETTFKNAFAQSDDEGENEEEDDSERENEEEDDSERENEEEDDSEREDESEEEGENKNQDEESEEQDEELEIQVEIEDGVAKVEIEHNDEELEFELDTTDEDAIIDEIVTITGLTKEEIEAVIEFEIAEDQEDIEDKDTEDNSEDANKAIADAEEEINRAQEKIEEAKEKGKDISASELALEEALQKLEEAKLNFELEDFEMSEELAEEAEDLASDARMSLLGKNIEDETEPEDEIEEETEIEVEIKSTRTKVKIEHNGEESKFILDTTDENEVLGVISKKTGLTESQIQEIWELEVESEDKDDSTELEHDTKITQKKDEAIQNAQERLAELESQILELEQRIQDLLEKLQTGQYFGNIEDTDEVTKSLSMFFDGSADSIQDEAEAIVFGELFLETQYTNQNISKLRITGGEIIIGDTYYDVMFGKARISPSGPSGDKDSMIVIGEVMDQEGNVSTIRLSINSQVPMDVDFGQEPINIQIVTPSKIAKQWSFEASGKMELL